jgi:hypothetical protein
VAWLIEGDDETRFDRRSIEKTLLTRSQELDSPAPPLDRRGRIPRNA